MPTINLSSKSSILQVYLIDENTCKTYTKSKVFVTQNYKGKNKKILALPESNEIYVGTTFENESMTADPFAVVDFYAIGGILAKKLIKTKCAEFQVNSLIGISPSDLEKFVLGVSQGFYTFDKYLKEKKAIDPIIYFSSELSTLITEPSYKLINSINHGMTLCRNIVNDTPDAINPETIIPIIHAELGNKSNIDIKIYSFEELQKMGMNAIVAVGKASDKKPILVHAVLKPTGEIKNKIVLIGKGLTYDCGGLDIKTEGHMKDMKSDMAGAGTMFGAISTLSNMDIQHTEVHWISPFVENVIAGNAYKSDDIITTYSGQTVEVWNTDAEGRLALADSLAFATLQNPDYIIDAATLTGACIRAISERFTALMTNSKEFKNELLPIFESELEPTMYTAMPEILRENVEGDIADLVNTGSLERQAGHLTAGLFLSHFVDQNLFNNPSLNITKPKAYKWVHLDIAGTAFNFGNNQLECDGATGQSIRSLVKWVVAVDGRGV